MADTRAKDRSNILDYLATVVSEKMPEIADFYDEFPSIQAASGGNELQVVKHNLVPADFLLGELKKLASSVHSLEGELSQISGKQKFFDFDCPQMWMKAICCIWNSRFNRPPFN